MEWATHHTVHDLKIKAALGLHSHNSIIKQQCREVGMLRNIEASVDHGPQEQPKTKTVAKRTAATPPRAAAG